MSMADRDTIMAYLDGELDAEARRVVEADKAAMAEIAALQRQADAIRALYDPAAAEPLPARLSPHRLALLHNRRHREGLLRAAMVVAVLGIGVAAGWLLRPVPAPASLYEHLIADAVSAHTIYTAENRHAVEVPGSEGEHLSAWLSSKLATALPMPDLSKEGFAFLGGRLLPAPALSGGRAAQLMYEDARGERLTLYLTPAAGVDGPEFELVRLGGDNALYWADARITCTIVGPQPAERLQALAGAIFPQLSPVPASAPAYREL
ncbi:anti-sigma factor family protein [Devosia elaeis]|uniref:Anti-sigma factor n=1 Tax=Devosia elaeis TaxID=1770058 RepID=A0A178HZU0_9HYPH|nr:anti-sigma factor [Devosia elaeis]OAM77468.1 hypothetical protein A3840_09695 [Devosia elaeis]